jgi:hypothetical protein
MGPNRYLRWLIFNRRNKQPTHLRMPLGLAYT